MFLLPENFIPCVSKMSHLVDWRPLIQKAGMDGEIDHDVTFTVIESGVFSNENVAGTAATVGAHKFVLCLVRFCPFFGCKQQSTNF